MSNVARPGQVAHIVLVQWRAETPAGTVAELERLADDFATGIPGVLGVTRGASASPEGLEAGFEWAMIVNFVDAAARDSYLGHPVHAPVAALISRWSERLVVFDVEH